MSISEGTTTKTVRRSSVRTMVEVGMLSGIAVVLMLFEFPLPFIAPNFYEIDLSEVPVLIGAFALGPVAGITIEFIKILLNLVINGTDTAFVGEIANLCMGCAFVVPAALIYKHKKTKKNAMLGLAAGTVIMTIVACFLNAYVLLPAYAAAFGLPIENFVSMGSAINASITNVATFAVFAVAPFNIIKGVVVSVVTLLLYKYVSPILKGHH